MWKEWPASGPYTHLRKGRGGDVSDLTNRDSPLGKAAPIFVDHEHEGNALIIVGDHVPVHNLARVVVGLAKSDPQKKSQAV